MNSPFFLPQFVGLVHKSLVLKQQWRIVITKKKGYGVHFDSRIEAAESTRVKVEKERAEDKR